MTRKSKLERPRRHENPLDSLRRVMSVPAIEGLAREVITRLNHRDPDDWIAPPEDVHKLSQLLCARYPYAADRMVDQLVKAGVPVERIYHNYLAEAARKLGARWEKNELSFEEVGIATARIYVILDGLRRQAPPPITTRNPRIAFASVPGERHLIGLKMAVDVFRREGWNVIHWVDLTHDQIVEAAQDSDIVLVGLSSSGRRTRGSLLKLVVALRLCRPGLKILLSGEITKSEPDFLSEVGIDQIVNDIPTALEAVERLLRDLPNSSG